ncbi:hypothetical protein HMI56_007689 [Coelomomyces lativittatus]|nr:hypothetical protein HMI56_007689 [Coelomomyces lativittatus]
MDLASRLQPSWDPFQYSIPCFSWDSSQLPSASSSRFSSCFQPSTTRCTTYFYQTYQSPPKRVHQLSSPHLTNDQSSSPAWISNQCPKECLDPILPNNLPWFQSQY